MNTCIERVANWLNHHKKVREWCWFFLLWFSGLFAVVAMSYPIKLLIRAMG